MSEHPNTSSPAPDNNSETIESLLREIRDDQREALHLTKSPIRVLRFLLWLLVGIVLIVGIGSVAFFINVIARINALD
jgi:hypothetical protein